MMMADKRGNAHNVVHVGMSDKYGINWFDDPFGKVRYLAAVEKKRSLERPNPYEEERIVQQSSEKCRLNISERQTTFHPVSVPSAA